MRGPWSRFLSVPGTSCQERFLTCVTDTSLVRGNPARYRFTKNLGHGSESTLYEAIDTLTGAEVIVKKIKKKNSWLNELAMLEKMASVPGDIVRLVDFYENHLRAFIVMEKIPGVNFLNFMRRRPYEEEATALRIFRDMVLCVKACHDANVVHLDIKCENFVLDGGGRPKLIDFGHAIGVPDITKMYTPRFYGTKYFRCPEGHVNRFYSSKSDIWSLGICLSIMLTGEFPYSVTRNTTFYGNALNNAFDFKIPPTGLRPEVVELMKACLDANPAARPTAAAIIARLDGIMRR